MSKDSDFGGEVEGQDKFVITPLPPPRVDSLQRPLIFGKQTSITAGSRLSINVSQSSITGAGDKGDDSHGPTVTFNRLTYRVKDRNAPLGVKNILLNVSGQFDWGKLSCILGASGCGRSSLLHILAGDLGFQSEVTGEILFNGKEVDPALPLWERCAFVEASDEQIRDISVKDVIVYAMKLRCPTRASLSVVEQNVKDTMEILHLEE